MTDDARHIRAYRDGDMSGFHTLYTRYERPVFFYIVSMVRDHHAAEDIFQDVWIQVVDKLPSFSGKGSFKNWLYTIAHHKTIDAIRRAGRSRHVSLDAPVDDDGAATFHDVLPDPAPDIVTRLATEELHGFVRDAVETLSDVQREVFLLRCDAGLKFKEIAEMTGAPLNTVLGRMHYAMNKIRNYLTEVTKDENAA